ncbi:site-specific DNA-methyltransferase [Aeromonas sp. 102P]|uniref:site-specific DNA-methyltransferase n=1 Tax=Aeromonas sp. 102P TaxID=3452711 RepID=UPI003F7986B3
MEKLKMHSPNLVEQNIEKLAELFPNCVTETKGADGKLQQAIDFDLLKQELSRHIVEGPQERYHLNWPGKREALLTANAPIAKTLRPCREESVNFDITQNLFIEGDNLEALKLLQETYLGKVKMIYIDPPYNTGSDFVYCDDFAEDVDSYIERSNQKDEQGNRLISNSDSNGRFHSDWLSMMYSRLKLSRNLLTDNGIVMLSIGDGEVHNLKKLCDEIFGEDNFILCFSRLMKSGGAKGRFYTPSIDYILVYAKKIDSARYFRKPLTQEQITRFYNKLESSGEKAGQLYGEERLYKASLDHRPNQRYYIECPDGTFVIPPGVNFPSAIAHGEKIIPSAEDGVWKWIFERYETERKLGNIVFKETTTSPLLDESGKQSKWSIYNKLWLIEQQEKGAVPSNFIGDFENRQSSAELKAIDIPFDFAKPSGLITYLIGLVGVETNDIVLDFFAGSASTAHAVVKMNANDGFNRRFILVQLKEACHPDSEEFRKGYKFISDISKERIKRVGCNVIASEHSELWNRDVGFRVLKIDTSNMSEVYYNPDVLVQEDLFSQVENVKEERTEEDLLFQVMLDWGVDLTLPIRRETIVDKTVFFVDAQPDNSQGALVACFDKTGGVNEAFIKQLAAFSPLRLVFRDAGFSSDAAKINVEQLLKQLSPTTDVKTI